jgi:hypothetical protein
MKKLNKNMRTIEANLMLAIDIDKNSHFYRNCVRQRKRSAKICESCPFKKYIQTIDNEPNKI